MYRDGTAVIDEDRRLQIIYTADEIPVVRGLSLFFDSTKEISVYRLDMPLDRLIAEAED